MNVNAPERRNQEGVSQRPAPNRICGVYGTLYFHLDNNPHNCPCCGGNVTWPLIRGPRGNLASEPFPLLHHLQPPQLGAVDRGFIPGNTAAFRDGVSTPEVCSTLWNLEVLPGTRPLIDRPRAGSLPVRLEQSALHLEFRQ